MAETAVLVPVPDVAPHVDGHRTRLTRAGAAGIPPHVTLLYPFLDTTELSTADLDTVARIVATVERFDLTFRAAATFGGDPPTLYLVPDPAAPFVELTHALVSAFPAHLPYGGVHEDVVPHLTVATADADTLAAVAAAFGPSLPLVAAVAEAWLMQCDEYGRWHLRRRFALR